MEVDKESLARIDSHGVVLQSYRRELSEVVVHSVVWSFG